MKNNYWFKLVGIIAALLAISAIIFLSFPRRMIHPEDFSPIGYLIAFLLSLLAIARLPKKERSWLYWLYAGLAIFLGLEEISFGVEKEWFQGIYIENFDLEIYDVHNLVPVTLRRIGDALGIERLSGDLLSRFIIFDLALIGFAMGLPFVFEYFKKKPQQDLPKISIFFVLSGIVSLGALFSLARLPSDPKNAVILGFSLVRFLPMLGLGLMSLASLWLAVIGKNSRLLMRIEAWLKKSYRWLARLAWIGLMIGIVTQFLFSVNLNEQQIVRLARYQPLLSWGMLQLILLALLALSRDTKGKARLLARPEQQRIS